MNKRPPLNEIPLALAFQGKATITCDTGAWDELLKNAYKMGWTLLEI